MIDRLNKGFLLLIRVCSASAACGGLVMYCIVLYCVVLYCVVCVVIHQKHRGTPVSAAAASAPSSSTQSCSAQWDY